MQNAQIAYAKRRHHRREALLCSTPKSGNRSEHLGWLVSQALLAWLGAVFPRIDSIRPRPWPKFRVRNAAYRWQHPKKIWGKYKKEGENKPSIGERFRPQKDAQRLLGKNPHRQTLLAGTSWLEINPYKHNLNQRSNKSTKKPLSDCWLAFSLRRESVLASFGL